MVVMLVLVIVVAIEMIAIMVIVARKKAVTLGLRSPGTLKG